MVKSVSPKEVASLLSTPKSSVVLLDVREDDERESARIEPSIHIPMRQVADHLDELPREGTLVVYCHHGGRSATVAAHLESEGFTNVANLIGGIDAWSKFVDPKVPRYG